MGLVKPERLALATASPDLTFDMGAIIDRGSPKGKPGVTRLNDPFVLTGILRAAALSIAGRQ
ncbi:hypothetical protein VSX64_10240 [Aurantimonas sp. C2-6-R+9]|uniref:hypothetical protein n=1 Tax=unclassified Aurantimonas TaxID=2638230 RepID=UPI002E181CC3|nr:MULTISPECIES: hypothetical protein [unclassified Aurantimonas]MEC5290990.1 hypothetical protein [Aurantimonas sp. C2-3-R2]MEC5381255.1 hypothetical protein [Aurantimonas sp. C2-6-R+9]MEC5412077.1 hypothetical protein [Aurantimonas sp. C2-4-R8]